MSKETEIFLLKDVVYKNILNVTYLSLQSNNVTGIVGKSGSGKTTLLRLLNKMNTPDAGEVAYKGESLSEIQPTELRRKVVMMAQTPVIFDGNIKDNLLMGVRFSERKDVPDEELEKALHAVELEKALTDEVEKLSGGEKQRLALARVVIMKPEVLLLDEPSSAFDDNTEDEVMGKIIAFGKMYDIKLIFVTHSLAMAHKYADEVIQIEKGQIVSIKSKEKDE